jgi:hypothetical protein
MTEDNTGFKVADRRLFTAEGDLRDTAADQSTSEKGFASKPSGQIPPSDAEMFGEMPVTFQTLIFSLSTTALLQLGIAPNPAAGNLETDLPAAKQTIDILEILQQKTKGNLTSEEAQTLEECLYDLKMSYVRIVQGGKP